MIFSDQAKYTICKHCDNTGYDKPSIYQCLGIVFVPFYSLSIAYSYEYITREN